MAAAPDATQEATLVPDHIQEVSSASSVPTLREQNQLVIGNRLNFIAHRLCK
jgi:hypothetical protein